MRRDLLAKVADAMPEVTDRRRRERIARGACVAMVMCVLEGLLFRRYTDRIMRELRVEGMENLPSCGAVLVANHQSIVDIPMLLSAFPRPVRFLAKRELGEIPLFGKAMAAAGNLFIDRDDPRNAVRMLRDVGARLRDGRLVVVFPEGTRSGDGSIGEFRPGAFYLAQKSGAPVVPVYIGGGRIALPKGSLRVRPADLLVRVLPPLSPDEGAGGSKEQIAESVRSRLIREGER